MLFSLFLHPTSVSLKAAHSQLYFSNCLYWYWNLFTSYIMTKKDCNQYCMYRNLCVKSLHTIRSISRSLIIGPKWNTFKIWIDTTKLPFKEWFFNFFLFTFLYLFFHPLAQQGLILFTTRSFSPSLLYPGHFLLLRTTETLLELSVTELGSFITGKVMITY